MEHFPVSWASSTLPLSLSSSSGSEPSNKKQKFTFVCPNNGFENWTQLPVAVMRIVFSHVDFETTLSSTLVCSRWNWVLKTSSHGHPFLIDVRKIPALIEAGITRCTVPEHGKMTYRHLKSVIDLVGGRERYFALPEFNQEQWPEGKTLTCLCLHDLPGPLVRGKTQEGRPFILFCHLNSFDDYDEEWGHVGFLVQNECGLGWQISFGANWMTAPLVRSGSTPLSAAHFLTPGNQAKGFDPGDPNNIIGTIIRPMKVLKELFRRPATSETTVANVETELTRFNIKNDLTISKGFIVLLDVHRVPMDETEDT